MYEYSQIKEANNEIKNHMGMLIEALNGQEYESVVLFGAYGKGEGGWKNNRPVNDYDILVVGGNVKTENALKKTKVPIEVEVHMVDSIKDVVCTQQWYEIKYGSKLLAGKPLELPDWEAYDIPYEDAVNSLNRRVGSMFVGIHELRKDKPDLHKVFTQTGKMIIAIGDAILIKRGQFNPSYRTRDLMLISDNIHGLYDLAVNHKILGILEYTPDDIWGLWHQTQEYFRKYIVENSINTLFSDLLISYNDSISNDDLHQLCLKMGLDRWL